MRCITPQITWHNRDPVLSIDFDPSSDLSQGFYRLATGGADTHLLIWHLREHDTLNPVLSCVAELTRHQKAVNIVRFSPDGTLLASADDDAYICIWKCESKTSTEETWQVDKVLRRHLEDVSDLCWSGDGAFLVSGSFDNTAVVWDVKKNHAVHIWSEHNGLVEGIAFDPRGELVATMCTDRILRVFNTKTGKLASKTSKYPDSWLPEIKQKQRRDVLEPQQPPPKEKEELKEPNGEQEPEPVVAKPAMTTTPLLPPNRLFQDDDTLRSFSRRLSFSPRGELLMIPGGILPPKAKEVTTEKESSTSSSPSAASVVNETPDPSSSKKCKKEKEGGAATNHAVILFCQNSFGVPAAVIPTGSSCSIGARFCPAYFQRRHSHEAFAYDPEFANPTKKSERLVGCVGKLRDGKKEKKVLMDMPYKLTYAIATNNSVIIGDTESAQPLALVRNIHFTRMSDLTWSSDGRVLLVSSTDGFCSIITFAEKELGIRLEETPVDLIPNPNCFPVTQEPKKKEKKLVKKEKKEVVKEVLGVVVEEEAPAPVMPVLTPESPIKKLDEPKLIDIFKRMAEEMKRKQKEFGPEVEPKMPELKPEVETEEGGDAEANATPKPKAPPQKNTLDKWIIKSKAAKTPSSSENEAQRKPPSNGNIGDTGKDKVSGNPSGKVLGFSPRQYIPTVDIAATMTKESKTDLIVDNKAITPAVIDQLEHAPMIIDLEEESSESGFVLTMSSTAEKENKLKEEEAIVGQGLLLQRNESRTTTPIKLAVIDDEDKKQKELSVESLEDKDKECNQTPPPIERANAKRPATSPLTSNPQKQPRRVQLITLSSSVPLDKKN